MSTNGIPHISSKRPRYHLTPPRGWMNDPCAPFQDLDGVYHVYFQYVPNSTEWTNEIGWGHAWTQDLIHWERDEQPCLMPSESYDELGVFTGNLVPSSSSSSSSSSGQLTAVYSAINVKARTPGYTNGQELLALATSSDGGRSWRKSPSNPLPLRPPPNVCPIHNPLPPFQAEYECQVTGWRDPSFFPWPRMAKHHSLPLNTTFGMISGGLQHLGPTVFLYALPPDLTVDWRYLGPLIRPERRPDRPRSVWTGDRGWNWECGGYCEVDGRDVVVVSSEGDYKEDLRVDREEMVDAKRKAPRWQLWFSGSLADADARDDGGGDMLEYKETNMGRARMKVEMEGVLDRGDLYAAQVFTDNSGRQIMWGWLPDDDLNPSLRAEQGWAGAISLPRELFWQSTSNVLSALHTPLDELPGFEVERYKSDCPAGTDVHTATMWTLGIRPVKELEAIREAEVNLTNTSTEMEGSNAWEAEMIVPVEGLSEVGLMLSFPNGEARITFRPADERILVQRKKSTVIPDIVTEPEHGKHTLFRTTTGWEPLHLRVFFDSPLLEIFANDRFALSTHLYGGECTVAPYTIPETNTGRSKGSALRARAWHLTTR